VPAFDRALQAAVSRELRRACEIADVMSAVAAEVRLARFLVQVSSQMVERGQSPRRLLLRMNRRDIASYLGVAHATASRSFGALADAGYLKVDNRAVEIVDLDGLKVCARNTRGTLEDMAARA
jgi:CRP/FNR family transcriptional regulator